jgi:cytidylate kinase
MLDDRTKAEAKGGSVVIDAQLGAWMARELVDVKVLLTAPDDVRFRRIAEREAVGLEEARKETEYRESVQRKRYREYYGIDVGDESIYDIKIDTNRHPIEETKRIVIESVRNLLMQRGKMRGSD